MYEERNRLVEENMNLIGKAIGLYTSKERTMNNVVIDEDDLYQAGAEGLIRAANTFDESLGYTFSSYAMRCIRNALYTEFNKYKVNDSTFEEYACTSLDDEKTRIVYENAAPHKSDILEKEFELSLSSNLDRIEENHKGKNFSLGKKLAFLMARGNTLTEACEQLNVTKSSGKSAYQTFRYIMISDKNRYEW